MNLHSNEKKVLLALVICMLVATIGVSFAYFVSEGPNIIGHGSEAQGNNGNIMKVEYDAGESSLNLANAFPGSSDSKAFSVKITPTNLSNRVKYVVKLDVTANTFVSVCEGVVTCTEDLVYTLKNKSGQVLANGDLSAKTGSIELLVVDETYAAEALNEYVLEVTFVKKDEEQNDNSNKGFEAELKVELAA